MYHANWYKKKAGVAIHISDKLDFKPKSVIRDEEGHYIIIKGSIQKGAEREGEWESQAGSILAWYGARIHKLWDHDLSWSQELDVQPT